jgi:septum formation protein
VADLILASTSPWRRQMLEAVGLPVRCEASGFDERSVQESDPPTLALTLAVAKARAVAERYPLAFVLGADQVVSDGHEVWGKPEDPQDHLRRLQQMRGNSHQLITGFALVLPGGGLETGTESTRMWMRPDVTDAELVGYVDSEEGSQCAGGYAAEGRGAWLFERIDGDWFNVLGLPLFRVLDRLRAHGFRLPGPQP